MEATLTSRGIWIMAANFPYAKVAFATVNMKPRIIATAIRVDFTDYDAQPLSVKFVDPFEDRELPAGELLTNLPRRAPSAQLPPWMPPEIAAQIPVQLIPLCQSYAPDKPAWLCLPGVREYHEHPGHTGDAWELHRASGAGSLFSIVDTVWRYGSAPLSQLNVLLAQPSIQFGQKEYPE